MDKTKYDELIDLVLNKNTLAENGVFILEHQSRQKFETSKPVGNTKVWKRKFQFFAKSRLIIINYILLHSENRMELFINLRNTNK